MCLLAVDHVVRRRFCGLPMGWVLQSKLNHRQEYHKVCFGDINQIIIFRVVFTQYAARLDQKDNEWEDYEERLRNSIIGILPCDLMCSDPLTPEKLTPVDVMTASFCFSTAADDYEDFENCLERMSEYLRTDGTLILTDYLEGSYYIVDDEKFHLCRLTAEEYISALKYAGYHNFEISKASESDVTPNSALTDAQDVIVIRATKKPPLPDGPPRPDTPPPS